MYGATVPHPERPGISLDAAQQQLVEGNLRLAYWVVQRMRRSATYRRADRDEMEGAALYGLCVAALRYEPARGVKFATYATWFCRSYAQATIRRAGSLNVPGQHVTQRGRGLTAERTDLADRAWACTQLPPHLTASPSTCTEPDAEDHEGAARLLRVLPVRARRIVEARVLEGLTLAEVGEREGISRERVRQIEQRAFARMRLRGLTGSSEYGA